MKSKKLVRRSKMTLTGINHMKKKKEKKEKTDMEGEIDCEQVTRTQLTHQHSVLSVNGRTVGTQSAEEKAVQQGQRAFGGSAKAEVQ